MRILGNEIELIRRKEALERTREMLGSDEQHFIVTPNPEMLVAAYRDPGFQSLIARASLALPDGFGLQLVSLLGGQMIPERITGTDFLDDLMCLADETGHRVCFLGGQDDVAERAGDHFVSRYPSLQIVHAESGGAIELIKRQSDRVNKAIESPWVMDPALLDRIRVAEPEILAVALGHGKQEQWIFDHLPELPTVKVAIGVGGAFDFWSGEMRRAPGWMRRIGFEWLWRLLVQPRRWRRIVTAVFIFPILVIKERITPSRSPLS